MTPSKPIGSSKLRDNPDALEAWAAGAAPRPLVVEATVTGGCNHDCVHCGSQQFRPYPDGYTFIDHDAFLRFLADFSAMGGMEVFYAGWGEPMLHAGIHEFLTEGRRLGLTNVMSSNGVALTEKRAPDILPHLKWVRFSVNGGDAQSYAEVHKCPEEDFVKLRHNLAAARKVRDKLKLETKLFMQFIVLDANHHTIRDAVALHKEVGTDQLVFRNPGNRERMLPKVWPEIQRTLQKVENGGDVVARWETFSMPEKWPSWKRCHGVNFRLNVDSEGNLLTCSKHLLEDCIYGNITEQHFPDIWNSERRKQVFNRVEKGEGISECSLFCQAATDNIIIDEYLDGAEDGA